MLRPYTTRTTQDERQCGGNPISGIGGFRRVFELQQMRHHCPHLRLLGSPRTDHRLLDHCGCILGDFESLLLGGEQDDAPCMTKHESGTNVLMIEGVFQGEHGWLVAPDQFGDFMMQLSQAVW